MNFYIVVFYLVWRYVWEEQFSSEIIQQCIEVNLSSPLQCLTLGKFGNLFLDWGNSKHRSIFFCDCDFFRCLFLTKTWNDPTFLENLLFGKCFCHHNIKIVLIELLHIRNGKKKTCIFKEKTCWHMTDDEAYAVYFEVQKVEDKSWLFFALTSMLSSALHYKG